jgi:hypothetical protein
MDGDCVCGGGIVVKGVFVVVVVDFELFRFLVFFPPAADGEDGMDIFMRDAGVAGDILVDWIGVGRGDLVVAE